MRVKSIQEKVAAICLVLTALVLSPTVATANNDYSYCSPCAEKCSKCGFEDELCKCYKETTCFLNEWGIHIDTLYWKATEENLSLGNEVFVERSGLNPATGIYDLVVKDSKEKTPDFDFDTGYRFNISHELPNHNCYIYFEWTHFDTTATAKGRSKLSSDPNTNTYTAFMSNWEALDNNFPNRAKGKWKLDMDLFDLAAGRNFCLSSCFTVRPYLGLRCARIDQKFRVKSYAHQGGVFNSASYNYKSHVKAHCDYLSVGPLLGCNAEINLCRGFTLFGLAAGSLVYGQFDCHSHERFNNFDDFFFKFNHYEDRVRNASERWGSRAMSEFALGLRWETRCNLSRWEFPIAIAVSWEHHAFYDFNNFNFHKDTFTNTDQSAFEFGPYANLKRINNEQGNLYTQGLTVSTRIGF